jgi:nitrogen regulatory protein PII
LSECALDTFLSPPWEPSDDYTIGPGDDEEFVASLEVLATDEDVQSVVEAIVGAASTGSIGDGKVWVTPVASVVRIRTGESGDAAI